MSASRTSAAEAWAERVRAGRAQIERLREVDEPADFYGPMARRFALDPRRTDEPALAVLLGMAQPDETWLDIGAGGGRYALPLALRLRRVVALEPSAAMLAVLREGVAQYGIENIEVVEDRWPTGLHLDPVDVALMAHVGYDIEGFAACLDAAEAIASRCVVVMRSSGAARINHLLWPRVHGEARMAYPMLPELLELLAARGSTAQVTYVERGGWGFDSAEQLLQAARRLLYLRPGSAKDEMLARIVRDEATEGDEGWDIGHGQMQDGIVSWQTLP